MALVFPLSVSVEAEIAVLLITLFLTTIFLFLIRLKCEQGNENNRPPLPPGPYGLPIVGCLPFLKPNLHHHFLNLARSYGPVFSLRLGSKLCVVVSSPSAAREIMKDQDAAFANRAIPAAAISSFAGSNPDMLWAPYGTHWRILRKITAQVLHIEAGARLRRREMRLTAEDLCARAKNRQAVHVRETAFLTFLNMTTSMLWGEGVGSDGEGKEFSRAIAEVIDLFLAPNVADFFPMVAPIDPQGLGRRIKKLTGSIDKYLEAIVAKKKQKVAGGGERSEDVLEALLDHVDTANPQVPFTLDDFYNLLRVSRTAANFIMHDFNL